MESAVKLNSLIYLLPDISTSEWKNEFGAKLTDTPGNFEATKEQAMRIYTEQQQHGITREERKAPCRFVEHFENCKMQRVPSVHHQTKYSWV